MFIIAVAIIYAAAARRVTDFPGGAERANFLAVRTQIQSGINLEMMLFITRGQSGQLRAFEDANPMDLLLEAPSNYVGSIDQSGASSLDRRVWYFDTSSKQLVYLINDNSGAYLLNEGVKQPASEFRFSLKPQYRYEDINTGLPVELFDDAEERKSSEDTRRSLSGLILEPVTPYEWGADINVLAAASAIET